MRGDSNDEHRYDDMLDMPHHVSTKHPRMSLHDRAAQFSPFAALTGYDAAIAETARLTDQRIGLSDSDKVVLNQKLHILMECVSDRPTIEVTYFVPDKKKAGGKYETISCTVKKVDEYEQAIILTDDRRIHFQDIIRFDGDLFAQVDDIHA